MVSKKISDSVFYAAMGFVLAFGGVFIILLREVHFVRFSLDFYGNSAVSIGVFMGILGLYFIVWAVRTLIKR